MKYNPRKVFIKEDGDYKAISYEEFCNLNEMSESLVARKFVPIQGCLLEVDEKTYKEIYREYERNRYLRHLDMENTVYQTDASEDNEGIMYCVNVVDEEFESRMIDRVMLEKLLTALELLTPAEHQLIDLIYRKGMSQREAAKALIITQSTLEYRINQLLDKLKSLLEK